MFYVLTVASVCMVLKLGVPFSDPDFVQYVMSLDPTLKMNSYGIGKYLLRRAFEEGWLTSLIPYLIERKLPSVTPLDIAWSISSKRSLREHIPMTL